MALAKTNVAAYKTNPGEGNEEAFSISTTAMIFNSNEKIEPVVNGNGINVIFMRGLTKIFVSENREEYSEIDLGYIINDVIYSETMNKFIAVGTREDKPKIKTSYTAIDWAEEDWGDFGLGKYSKSGLDNILEIGEKFLILGNYYESMKQYFAISVLFLNDSYVYSEKMFLQTNTYTNIFKGNNRMASKPEGNIRGKIITLEGIMDTSYYPAAVADGYFIAIAGQKLYRSINGVDYNLLGTCAIEPVCAMKHDGYYYIFGKNAVCRGKTWIEALNKGIEEYVPYDGGVEIPFTSVSLLDGQLALLCNGYIVVLNTGGGNDPMVETIETLSAKAALKKAMEYADGQIAFLEERIAALENLNSGSQTK